MREKELIVYKDFGEDGALLADMVWLMEHYGTGEEGIQKESSLLYECMHGCWKWPGKPWLFRQSVALLSDEPACE